MDKTAQLSKTIKLNSGYDMPTIGLGTFLSKNEGIMTELIRASFGTKTNPYSNE